MEQCPISLRARCWRERRLPHRLQRGPEERHDVCLEKRKDDVCGAQCQRPRRLVLFETIEKPNIAAPDWENEAVFGINKEQTIANYMPYALGSRNACRQGILRHPLTTPRSFALSLAQRHVAFPLRERTLEASARLLQGGLRHVFLGHNSCAIQLGNAGLRPPHLLQRGISALQYPQPYIKARPYYNDGGKNYGINPVGSYVRTFDLPEGWKERRTYLHFGGIYSAAYVWVNGEFVGYTQGANNDSEFEITQAAPCRPQLHRRSGVPLVRRFLPECQDMFRMSGIHRNVYLYNVPETAIRDHYITSQLFDGYQNARLNITYDTDTRCSQSAPNGGAALRHH